MSLYCGCGERTYVAQPPKINASASAERALEQYDGDGDGTIAGTELDEVPGIKAALETIDTDGNGQVTEEEIASRIRSWQETGAGLMSLRCEVIYNGQPLSEATVTFEPEPFLGEEMKTAVDETNLFGKASPSIPKENRPSPEAPSGLQLGLYRVKVSKTVDGEETIPAKYNTETTLGQQVALDEPDVLRQRIVFNLQKE